MHVDWNGLALFLPALGVFLTAIATLVMQIITWRDNRRGKIAAERRERTLNKMALKAGVEPENHCDKVP